jgi:hypothetical protein
MCIEQEEKREREKKKKNRLLYQISSFNTKWYRRVIIENHRNKIKLIF